jgi:hypothetical protein
VHGSVRTPCLPNERYCLASRIDHLIEGWNNWSHISQRSDAENYFNGDIKFALEYIERGRFNLSELRGFGSGVEKPIKSAIAERCSLFDLKGKIGGDSLDLIAGKQYVVIRWNQKPVLINDVHFMGKREKLVPSRFTMWAEPHQSAPKSCSCPIGESVLHSSLKSVCFFSEGELNRSQFSASAEGRNDLPIGMIEGGPNIMSDIPGYQTGAVYDGFVLFGENSAFSGAGICFEDNGERSRFIEKFVKLRDVFRGPVNFEKCAVCHGKA